MHITADMAIEALRAEVAGNENFVYYSPDDLGLCVYVNNDKPSCLVGKALHRLGVSIDSLNKDNDTGIATANFDGSFTMSEHARSIFMAAQKVQDAGQNWGFALSKAENVYA